ncbi:MAG: hypothetical protein IT512_07470 [Rhodocyclaceae bacterium]|nr:hypothetical protein [Rhodocyclaceae bacterium]
MAVISRSPRGGTHRMQQLIDDMLALSRITRDEIRRVDVNLSALAVLVVSVLNNTVLSG